MINCSRFARPHPVLVATAAATSKEAAIVSVAGACGAAVGAGAGADIFQHVKSAILASSGAWRGEILPRFYVSRRKTAQIEKVICINRESYYSWTSVYSDVTKMHGRLRSI